jgi:hypothetical protein
MTRSRDEPSGPGVDYRRGMASGAACLPYTREAWPGPTWDDGVGHCDPIGAWRSGGPVNTLNAVSNRSRAVHPGGPTGALVIRPAWGILPRRLPRGMIDPPTMFEAAGLSRSPGVLLRRPFLRMSSPPLHVWPPPRKRVGGVQASLAMAGQASRCSRPLVRSALGGAARFGSSTPSTLGRLIRAWERSGQGPIEMTPSSPATPGRGSQPVRMGRGGSVLDRAKSLDDGAQE